MDTDNGSSAGQVQAASWLIWYTSGELAQIQKSDPDLKVVLDWLDHSPQRPNRDVVARQSPAKPKASFTGTSEKSQFAIGFDKIVLVQIYT